jgi:hypothetical protein
METIIIAAMVIFTALVSLIVEGLMYRKPISEDRLSAYQIELDEKCKDVKKTFGTDWKYDAKTQIQLKQRQVQSFVCLIATAVLVIFFIQSWSWLPPSFTSALIACLCGVALFGNSLVKWMLSWKVTIFMLISIALLGGALYIIIC